MFQPSFDANMLGYETAPWMRFRYLDHCCLLDRLFLSGSCQHQRTGDRDSARQPPDGGPRRAACAWRPPRADHESTHMRHGQADRQPERDPDVPVHAPTLHQRAPAVNRQHQDRKDSAYQ